MALLRRRGAEQPQPAEGAQPGTDDGGRGAGKGRPTPKRAEARSGRTTTYKGDAKAYKGDAKAARRGGQVARRAQAQEYRLAMRTGDVSRMPPRERAPERVLARDIVDSRRNIGPTFLILAVIYFLSPITQSYGVVIAAQILMFVGLVAVIVDSFYVGRKVSRAIAERGLDPTVKVRGYAAQRALLPKRWRMPRTRITTTPGRGRR